MIRPCTLSLALFAAVGASASGAEDCNGNGLPDPLDITPTPSLNIVDVPTADFPHSTTATAVETGGARVPFDVNGDGHPDLLVSHHAPGGVSVHVNDGAGDLSASTYYPVANASWTAVAGDMDGDGDHDIVIGQSDPPSIRILINDGQGGFTTGAVVPLARLPTQSVIADLDGDGDLDVAAVRVTAVSIILNDGSGGLTLDSEWAIVTARSITAGDFDGDTDIDLAVESQSDWAVTVLLNDGSAGFPFAGTFDAGAPLDSVLAADVDDDGDPDLVCASSAFSRILVMRNTGDATFGDPERYAVTNNPRWLVAADLDGDGDDDLAAADQATGDTVVLRNVGDGTFAGPLSAPGGGFPNGPAITAADFDGNGYADLAIHDSNFPDSHLRVYLNDPLPALDADCNGNGILDVCDLEPLLEFAPPLVFGTGVEPVVVQATAIDAAHNVFPLDLDENGDVDLVTGNENGGTLSVLLNEGVDGKDEWLGFAPFVDYETGAGPTGLAAGDLDGDGHIDIAGTSVVGGDIDVFFGDGTGDLPDHIELLDEDNVPDVVMADFDGDGRLDLAATGANAEAVFVVLNDGDRTFRPAAEYDVGVAPRGLAAGDIDGDGHVDLVAANVFGGSISILYNKADGTGTFEPQVEIQVGHEPFHTAIARLDEDALPELIVTDQASPDAGLFVFPNLGGRNFGAPVPYTIGDAVRFVTAHDLDDDGDLDLVASNRFSHSVSVLLNRGDGSLTPVTEFAVGQTPGGVAVGDVDGDGRADLASADQFDDTVTIRRLSAVLGPLSADANDNGVPDECECPADIDGSGAVDFGDILAILSAWGNAGGPEDLDGSGVVDFGDILVVLSGWGPCS